jgi:hypothetical protein
VAVTAPTSESKERKMTDLEVVLNKELPLVFTRRRSLTCIKATVAHHRVNTWFITQMQLFLESQQKQLVRPKEGRW